MLTISFLINQLLFKITSIRYKNIDLFVNITSAKYYLVYKVKMVLTNLRK